MNFGKNYFNIISRKLTDNIIDILSMNNKFLQQKIKIKTEKHQNDKFYVKHAVLTKSWTYVFIPFI